MTLLVAASAHAQSIFAIDPAASNVMFTLPDVLHTVHGSFAVSSGLVSFDPPSGDMHGRIVVAAASGNSGSRMRDDRMAKDELHADEYTDVVFVPKHFKGSVPAQGDADVQVDGDFILLGQPHALQLPMHLHVANGQCAATGSFQVPYVDWGLKNPSTLMLRVSRQVQIGLELKGTLRSAP